MVAAGEHLSSSRPARRAKTRPAARIPLCVEPPTPFAEGPGPSRDWWERALSEKSFSGRKRGQSQQNQGVGANSRTTHLGPFGEVIRATGPIAKLNPFRFSTKFDDDESDFLYYGYRYYNPSTGRWLSKDPIGEPGFQLLKEGRQVFANLSPKRSNLLLQEPKGLNLYGFVENDPDDAFDVNGLSGGAACTLGSAAVYVGEGASAEEIAAGVAAAIAAVPVGAVIVTTAVVAGVVVVTYELCTCKPWKWKCKLIGSSPNRKDPNMTTCYYICKRWGGLGFDARTTTVPTTEGCPAAPIGTVAQ